MKGSSIDVMDWYEDYQSQELEIKQMARRSRKADPIIERRSSEIFRKAIGYTMLVCVILLVGSIGTIEISEEVPVGSLWIAILSQVVLYLLIIVQMRGGNND